MLEVLGGSTVLDVLTAGAADSATELEEIVEKIVETAELVVEMLVVEELVEIIVVTIELVVETLDVEDDDVVLETFGLGNS